MSELNMLRHLLRDAVAHQDPDLLPVVDTLGTVRLTDASRERLRTAVAAELTASGLDESGGHNARGVQLDDIIDALGHM